MQNFQGPTEAQHDAQQHQIWDLYPNPNLADSLVRSCDPQSSVLLHGGKCSVPLKLLAVQFQPQ